MVLVRVVSNDRDSEDLITLKSLRRLQILDWQDPTLDDILRSLSHEGKICPVIMSWRESHLKSA